MSKVTIEYDLPEEQADYALHFYAHSLYCALYDISNLLRSIEKGWDGNSEELYNEKLFEIIRDILSESKLWELE